MLLGKQSSQPDDKRRVLDATDIVRLIGEHVALKSKGREYVGVCPFHDDHKPSMYVVPQKQIYHCFSCGAGGDALTFVMGYHRMGFREALEHLAERAGITLAPRQQFRQHAPASADPAAGDVPREEMLEANGRAQSFFRAILAHAEHGAAARALIEKRGLTPETVELFGIGASPDKWDGLGVTIASKGWPAAPFRAVGLLKARDTGGHYDAFRNRLMFPIHDQIGRVIGFGARRIDDQDEPKYLNSPESALFNKSATLYALHQAAQAIRVSRVAIVTEGYMDAIACHQAGVRNAVATLGTALTRDNARILRRLCDKVVLLFDGDEAGQKAAERAVEVFFAEPVDVRIAILAGSTDAKDPDELLKRPGGAAELQKILSGAIDPMELLFARVRSQMSDQGLSARSRTVEEFLARLSDLGLDRVEKVRYQLVLKRLSAIAGVDWETIAQTLAERRGRRRVFAGAEDAQETPEGERRLRPAEHLLGCVMCEPALLNALTEEQSPLLDAEAYADGPVRAVARAIAELVVEEQAPTLQGVLGLLEDPDAQREAIRLASEVERLTEANAERLRQHWHDRLREAWRERVGPDVLGGAPSGAEGDFRLSFVSRIQGIKQNRKDADDPRAVPRPMS